MIRVKFPPAVTPGSIIVVLDGRGRADDVILERTEAMPLGAWGEVAMPPAYRKPPRRRRRAR